MASNSKQPIISSTTPHFFSIVLRDTLRDKKLPISKKFVKENGKTLTNPILVKLPCGSEWKMEFTKNDDGLVYLQKGWLEFEEHYSLKEGHLLVFRYEGNSQFHVIICDKSATEIDYPLLIPSHVEPNINGELKVPKTEEIEDDDSLENFDDISPCPKMREKSSTPCSCPHKRMKACNREVQTDISSHKPEGSRCHGKVLGNSSSKENLHGSESEMQGKRCFPIEIDGDQSSFSRKRKYELLKSMKTLNVSEKIEALQKTRGFNFEKPSFKVVMQPSYIYGKGLSLPSEFARRYLSNDLKNVILRVWGGSRTWSANYTFRVYDSVGLRAFLSGEWLAFAQDNNLEVGDVCIFVLHQDIQVSFDVVIFGKNENSETSMPTGVSAHEDGPIQEEPEGIRTNETEFCDTRTDRSGSTSNDETDTFSPKGDPINFRSRSTSNDETDTFSPKSTTSRKPSSSNGSRALKAARQFYSTRPFFQVFLLHSHLNSIMNAPVASWASSLKEKIQTVSLQVGERSWSVLLKVFRHQCLFCRGWAEFAKENSLCAGDVCVFVLIKTDPVVLKVTIFREEEKVVLF